MPDIQTQTADGVIHSFPDGTKPEVIDRVMKSYAQSKSTPGASSGLPEGSPTPVPTGLQGKPTFAERLNATGVPGSFEGHPENIGQYPADVASGVGGGAKDIAQGNYARGAHKIIGGASTALLPALPFAAAAAPGALALGAGGGYLGGKITGGIAKLNDATPDQQALAEDFGNIVGGGLGAKASGVVSNVPLRGTARAALLDPVTGKPTLTPASIAERALRTPEETAAALKAKADEPFIQKGDDLMKRQAEQDALDANYTKQGKAVPLKQSPYATQNAADTNFSEGKSGPFSPISQGPNWGTASDAFSPARSGSNAAAVDAFSPSGGQDIISRTRKLVVPGEDPTISDIKRAGDLTQAPVQRLKSLAKFGDKLAQIELNRRLKND